MVDTVEQTEQAPEMTQAERIQEAYRGMSKASLRLANVYKKIAETEDEVQRWTAKAEAAMAGVEDPFPELTLNAPESTDENTDGEQSTEGEQPPRRRRGRPSNAERARRAAEEAAANGEGDTDENAQHQAWASEQDQSNI